MKNTIKLCVQLYFRVIQKNYFFKIYAANDFSRYMILKNDIEKFFPKIFNF